VTARPPSAPAADTRRSAAVRLEGVTKSFGLRPVLADISFEVRAGTGFVILGRSGTGKSVTLRHIVGLVKPDSGRVLVNDDDVGRANSVELSRVRQGIGFLFQNAALFDSISVAENVAFPMRRHTRMSEEEIQTRVRDKLSAVGLENEGAMMPAALSGGMRKRAGLARALALDPPLLLVDEPSAGLDPITADEIDNLLLGLKQQGGTTLVIVTHNISSARRLGDELVMLHEGRVVARGTADEFDRSPHPIVRAFMASRHSG
jgi:phospholipid/cholesterol/gamma-HCH transport system ATP-binding protein